MFNNTVILRIRRSETGKMAAIKQFLKVNDLNLDARIEVFVAIIRHEELVACGGLAGNIIKCVAVSETVRGGGLALTLATELIHLAYEKQQTNLFIYTKTENESFFSQCGFHTLITVPDIMVLMENSRDRLKTYIQDLTRQRHEGQKIGSIVMNANPFTRGHRYLVEQAAAQCDWLHIFPVKENVSRFSYKARLNLMRQGTAGIKKITIHPGSEYIISRATFPNYFIKEKTAADQYYIEIDLKIFRHYIAPALGITHRFVGTEPLSPLTAYYNHGMRYWLKTPLLPDPPVETVEIDRLCYAGIPISASRVRRLMREGDTAAAAPLVPQTTLTYLQENAEIFHRKAALCSTPAPPQAKGEK